MGPVDLLPFFNQNMEGSKHNEPFRHMESSEFARGVLGVPTHFQNDGSALYLLTHALLPPSAVAVGHWLTQQSFSGKFCTESFLHRLFFVRYVVYCAYQFILCVC